MQRCKAAPGGVELRGSRRFVEHQPGNSAAMWRGLDGLALEAECSGASAVAAQVAARVRPQRIDRAYAEGKLPAGPVQDR